MNRLTPLAVRIGAIGWLSRLLPQITRLDKALQRLTRGRWSLLRIAGLPNIMLTVLGRRSGLPRSTPLLCVPYLRGVLVAGSNFGGARAPVWVINVRAALESAHLVTMTYQGQELAATPYELTGADREDAWAHMLQTWPNYQKYAERTGRVIPVFYLEPAA
jgi:deazaflavin-dependent oxidoreductase (nitroreductase family)